MSSGRSHDGNDAERGRTQRQSRRSVECQDRDDYQNGGAYHASTFSEALRLRVAIPRFLIFESRRPELCARRQFKDVLWRTLAKKGFPGSV